VRSQIALSVDAFIVNEVAPVVIYSLILAAALGGAWAVAVATCGWGHVKVSAVDFWKASVRVECR
jgi:hypothetical protein